MSKPRCPHCCSCGSICWDCYFDRLPEAKRHAALTHSLMYDNMEAYHRRFRCRHLRQRARDKQAREVQDIQDVIAQATAAAMAAGPRHD